MSDIESSSSSSDSQEFLQFMSSSSEEDVKEERRKKPKNEDYFEVTIPQYSEKEFIEHFRVSYNVADKIAERYAASKYYHHQAGEFGKITALQFTYIFLWYAGHEDAGFRDVADRFNISLSSLHKVKKRMTYFLSNLSPEIIKWPNEEEKNIIRQRFEANGFPGVIGVIDGTHVRIDKPIEDPDSYYNRKHYFSFQAQVVCDHRRFITDVFVGFPGSVHDSRVFRASPLFDTLPEKCEDNYILGDSGYPCQRHLLTPFRDRGHLTRAQTNYNTKLSTNRYIIEHYFGVLKQKFRQLYHLKMRKMEDMAHFFRACCVLHNLALNDFPAFHEEEEEIVDVARVLQEDGDNEHDDRGGIEMRNHVVNLLEQM